jgi:hypothetical protein
MGHVETPAYLQGIATILRAGAASALQVTRHVLQQIAGAAMKREHSTLLPGSMSKLAARSLAHGRRPRVFRG